MSGFFGTRLFGSAAVVVLLSIASPAHAEQFTFEGVALGSYPSSLAVTNGGLTLTVTPEGNPAGYVIVNSDSVGVALLGTRSVIGSNEASLQSGQFLPLRFSFSSPVSSITFAFGDAGGDNDSPVTIQAFTAANVSLGVINETYPSGFEDGKTASRTYSGASYFILRSDSTEGNAHSIFWEVTSVTRIPEPAAVTLVGVGALGLVGLRRQRHFRQAR